MAILDLERDLAVIQIVRDAPACTGATGRLRAPWPIPPTPPAAARPPPPPRPAPSGHKP